MIIMEYQVFVVVLYVIEQAQVLQLSPAPGEKDYFFHLDKREGLSDLYDIGVTLNTSSSYTPQKT